MAQRHLHQNILCKIYYYKSINTANHSLIDRPTCETYVINVLFLKIFLAGLISEAGQKIFFSVYERTNLSWLPVTERWNDDVQTRSNIHVYAS
jgi:hypothetical protein